MELPHARRPVRRSTRGLVPAVDSMCDRCVLETHGTSHTQARTLLETLTIGGGASLERALS